jgi:hypothetical protein
MRSSGGMVGFWDDCGAGRKRREQNSVWTSFSVQIVEIEDVLLVEVVREKSSEAGLTSHAGRSEGRNES